MPFISKIYLSAVSKLIFLTILLCFRIPENSSVFAQVIGPTEWDLQTFKTKVHLLSGFIRRFNHQDSIKELTTREKSIISLFSNNIVETTDRSILISFIKDVNNSKTPILLNKRDERWYALAEANGIYNGSNSNVKLVFNMQLNADNTIQWVILSAYADYLANLDSEINKEKYVLPANANDFNFNKLFGLNGKGEDIINYVSELYDYDHLPLILYHIQNQKLQIDNIWNLEYHFLQVPGWIFTVSKENKDEIFSGWKINSILRATDEEKRMYKRDILFLKSVGKEPMK